MSENQSTPNATPNEPAQEQPAAEGITSISETFTDELNAGLQTYGVRSLERLRAARQRRQPRR